MHHISLAVAKKQIIDSDELFLNLFKHGTLALEIYKPEKVDLQKPHSQDEIYIIAEGKADFFHEGDVKAVQKGDFLFVPAGDEHRFQSFSSDFSTWVIFYGPEGGEASMEKP